MKLKLLITSTFLYSCLVFSQGNTAGTAAAFSGTPVSIGTNYFNGVTASGFNLSSCHINSDPDVFYKHTPSGTDNKITIGISALGLLSSATMRYQIFEETNSSPGVYTSLFCSSCNIAVLGGAFSEEIVVGVSSTKTYYLRIIQPSGFTGVLPITSLTMSSTYDSTLSMGESAFNSELKVLIKESNLELVNNVDFSKYAVYGIEGKKILTGTISNSIISIDIASLNTGIYILNLQGENSSISRKFAKR